MQAKIRNRVVWMEFAYKRKMSLIYIFFTIIVGWYFFLPALADVTVYVLGNLGIGTITDDVKIFFIKGAIRLLVTTYVLLKMCKVFFYIGYFRKKKFVIDEAGIAVPGKDDMFLKWGEIEKVKIKNVFSLFSPNELYYFFDSINIPFEGLFLIEITGHKKKILIGSHAVEIREVIKLLKSNLGNKFKTYRIPVRYKTI